MEHQQWMNLLLFFAILLGAYFVFRNFKLNDIDQQYSMFKEGMENNESSEMNGIAGNGSTYLTQLKQQTTQLKDKFNLNNSEYRKNTEDIIIEMDKLLGYVTLQVILTTNKTKPQTSIVKLSELAQARIALNNALKFVDKQ